MKYQMLLWKLAHNMILRHKWISFVAASILTHIRSYQLFFFLFSQIFFYFYYSKE